MLHFTTPKHHWNYFLAIERDLETVSRYIEFCEANQKVYSIELSHILLSAASEVDVGLKLICQLITGNKAADSISKYKTVITDFLPSFLDEEISIDRFGIKHQPWINWKEAGNPDWWRSYNKVKHQRNDYFHQANLKNVINAVGALLITITYYYKLAFQNEAGHDVPFREVTRNLIPASSFLKINTEDYYYHQLIA